MFRKCVVLSVVCCGVVSAQITGGTVADAGMSGKTIQDILDMEQGGRDVEFSDIVGEERVVFGGVYMDGKTETAGFVADFGNIEIGGNNLGVGFSLLKTGIERNVDGNFLYVKLGKGDLEVWVKMEFADTSQLVSDVVRSVKNTFLFFTYSVLPSIDPWDLSLYDMEDGRRLIVEVSDPLGSGRVKIVDSEFPEECVSFEDYLDRHVSRLPAVFRGGDFTGGSFMYERGGEDARVENSGFGLVDSVLEPDPDIVFDPIRWYGFGSYYSHQNINFESSDFPILYRNSDSSNFLLDQWYPSLPVFYDVWMLPEYYTKDADIADDEYEGSGNPPQMFAQGLADVTTNESNGVVYEHTRWGSWSELRENDLEDSEFEKYPGPIVFGKLTPVEHIPLEGSASFDGELWGHLKYRTDPLSENFVNGDVSLVVEDFSKNSITGTFHNIVVSDGSTMGDFGVDMSIDRSSGALNGTIAGPYNGVVNARFSGPTANEMLGGWAFAEPGDVVLGSGFFVAK